MYDLFIFKMFVILFFQILRQQLDFKWEAYNNYRFTQNFKDDPTSATISFPHVSRKLSSEGVLVESWATGVYRGSAWYFEESGVVV